MTNHTRVPVCVDPSPPLSAGNTESEPAHTNPLTPQHQKQGETP